VESAVKNLTSGLGAHAVICTANGEGAYEQSMRLLRRLGVLVCVGIPNVPFRLPATPFDMIVKGWLFYLLSQSCHLIEREKGSADEV
jgi:propanol-preferring alcohol dehydrogenase